MIAITCIMVDVPEWLSGMTRNHVGSARAGSNPAVHVFWLYASKHLAFATNKAM